MGLRPAAARGCAPPEGKGQKKVVWPGQPDKDQEGTPKDTETMECAICYEAMTRDVIKTECGHRFHADCIGTWFQGHTTCPTCRTVVAPMADVAAPQYEGPLLHHPSRFSCRTVAPWDEVRWGVSTSAGLRLWMNELYGEEFITYSQLAGVRTWMAAAQVGDVAYLNDEGGLVGPGQGDFEIRCNTV